MTKKTEKPDLFGTAKKAEKVSKASGKERDEVNLGADLDRLAAFSILIQALEGAQKQLKSEMQTRCYEVYADKAAATKEHPASFVGAGEVATASCEMRRRGANAPLAPETVQILQEKGIAFTEAVRVPERFVFNQTHLQNDEIREAIIDSFLAHPKLKPIAGELIQKQEKEFVYSTSETTLADAAKLLSKDEYQEIVPLLSSLAVGKFKLQGEDVAEGKGEEKTVTPQAKALAIGMLQDMGVLPQSVSPKKKS